MKIILKITGFLHLLYYFLMITYAGIRTTFSIFWLIMGSFWLCLSFIPNKLLKWIRWPLCVIAGVFLGHEAAFAGAGRKKPQKGADYVIVLGAQVKGTRPSRALLRRIQKAKEYLDENPKTKVIASGGQGPREDITEAECIRNTLIDLGISKERILMEAVSTNTWENIKFSQVMAGGEHCFVLVTNGFHLFRAMKTAKMLGFKYVQGLGASEEPVLLVNYYVREFFAWMVYRRRSQ